MTTLRLALSELKRMTGGLLPKLALVALTLVPLLYGAVYLYANWDPYGNLDGVSAALVMEDEGAQTDDGERLEVGNTVADSLLEDGTFDWELVSDPDAADAGVMDGTYSFALKIPADFSASLASPSDFDTARQGILNVTTNDANNYLLGSIVDKLTGSVHDTVAAEVGEETANQLLTGFSTIHTQISDAADGAAEVAAGAAQAETGATELATGLETLRSGTAELYAGQQQLVTGSQSLAAGAADLNAGAGELSAGLSRLNAGAAALPDQTQTLATGAEQVAAGNFALNSEFQSAVAGVKAAQDAAAAQLQASTAELVASGVLTQDQADQVLAAAAEGGSTSSPDIAAQLDAAAASVQALADGSRQVADGAGQLAAGIPSLTGGISDAAAGAGALAEGTASLSTGSAELAAGQQDALAGTGQLSAGAGSAAEGAAALRDGLTTLAGGSEELSSGLAEGAGSVPNPDEQQRANAARVIANPVSVNTVAQNEADSYGAGIAPFFLVLALWVGVFMLVQAMRPISRRALASNAPAFKIALGGWLPFLAVAVAQSTVLYAVVRFGLGLSPAHPVLAWGLLLLAATAFSALIQGIVALLGSVGKFVVLVLLVLQLVSSGGTFPWETIPTPLHFAHDVLPMGHVVSGLRQLLYGSDPGQAGVVALGLAGYTVLGLVLSTLAARKHKMWTLKTLQPEIAV
ncbi:YhgE/Pip family protein [Arthrobacter sunyaminii]|uniref:YhgE/Pip family protein n=1 Tax=Arthrobacter sunyaminii TaxID=2816859 RepID=A0A975XKW0_9MICC|nr:YhgE/Pip family protein [Arthrobacter sunyaminii]MBO0909767.1 YhgE/Pip family protein [Arthrobacter sunyaminii]QWQ36561.1 YhgE/Pip family protein [Arthrobacter sunyaminii]